MADERPLLNFVTMVKDEASNIGAMIVSVRDHVDYITVFDTGSTDGTQDLARAAAGDTPFELFEGKFVDFSTSRNAALDFAGDKCVWSLMLSGDETLVDGEAVRAFLEAASESDSAFNMKIRWGSRMVYQHPRLTRNGSGWHYVGPTHEFLTNSNPDESCEKIAPGAVVHNRSHDDPKARRRRWRKDVQILTKYLKAHPSDARYTFYLAQSHMCLKNYKQAMKLYTRRLDMGGFYEEIYQARYEIANCAKHMGYEWPLVQQLYLEAYENNPKRAEPLYEIACHYYDNGRRYELAYQFASAAARVPFPVDQKLFVQKTVYEWGIDYMLGIVANNTRRFDEGAAACTRCLKFLPDHLLESNINNLRLNLTASVPAHELDERVKQIVLRERGGPVVGEGEEEGEDDDDESAVDATELMEFDEGDEDDDYDEDEDDDDDDYDDDE